MTQTIETVGATMGAEIKAFRSAAVTSENKATPMARSILGALVAGLTTAEGVVSTTIHAFGNPKSPKTGKPVAKLSGLRDFVGGDATRKTVESIMSVFANIDFDKAGEHNENKGAGSIRPLVVSFILAEATAPKSLKALADGVKTLIDAHVALTSPDNSEAVEETTEEHSGEAPAPAPMTVAERIAALIVAMEANPECVRDEATDEAIAKLMETVKTCYALAIEEDAETAPLADQNDPAVALSLAA